jgi:hypothetical protein
VVVFRNGASYYALVSDGASNEQLWDVTNPSAPVALPNLFTPGYREAAKSNDGRIAFTTTSRQLQIHTPATILADAAAIFTSAGPGNFREIATDGTNFYALGDSGRDIHVLQPSGGSYTDTITSSFNDMTNDRISYGAGYLTVSDSARMSMFQVNGTSLTLLEDGSYTFNWFVSLNPTYPLKSIRMALPVFDGSQTLLVAAFFGLGEVFTLTSPPPLTVAAQFSPSTILPGGVSLLTMTITNPNPVPVSFSLDQPYPADVFNTGAVVQTTCGNGILSAAASTSSFQLTNATVGASSNCTVTVQVTSDVAGTHTTTIPARAITSADNSNASAVSAGLIVDPIDAPSVQKAFSAGSAPPGVPVRMSITLTNPNAQQIVDVAFTDNYPANLVNATPANAFNTCGGTLLAANGGTSLSLSGGIIPASGSCVVEVDVIATQSGAITNTLPAGSVTSDNAEPNATPASARSMPLRRRRSRRSPSGQC